MARRRPFLWPVRAVARLWQGTARLEIASQTGPPTARGQDEDLNYMVHGEVELTYSPRASAISDACFAGRSERPAALWLSAACRPMRPRGHGRRRLLLAQGKQAPRPCLPRGARLLRPRPGCFCRDECR